MQTAAVDQGWQEALDCRYVHEVLTRLAKVDTVQRGFTDAKLTPD